MHALRGGTSTNPGGRTALSSSSRGPARRSPKAQRHVPHPALSRVRPTRRLVPVPCSCTVLPVACVLLVTKYSVQPPFNSRMDRLQLKAAANSVRHVLLLATGTCMSLCYVRLLHRRGVNALSWTSQRIYYNPM
jgi:hypothetical protein